MTYFYKLTPYFFLLLLAACAGSPSKQSASLRIPFPTEPTTLDPTKAGDFATSTLCCLVYEGLTRCLAEGNTQAALAQHTELSADQTVYLFHLRQAVWSDGQPITAHDFERSWKRVLTSASSCAYLCYPIKNAAQYMKGEVEIEQVGVYALNDQLLRVELEQPTPYFYSLLSLPTFLPAPPKPGLYSGPFQIETRVRNSKIVLKKNPSYWNGQQIDFDRIEIRIIPDEMTALHLFEQGDLDWIGGPLCPIPPDALDLLKKDLIYIPSAASTFCTFNTQTFPFHNLNLRKAFSYAIDRKEIAEQVMQPGQIEAHSFLPPLFSSESISLSDPDLARFHLQKGLEELQIDLHDLKPLTLFFKSNQSDKRLAVNLQRQWKDTLGVEIHLSQLDMKVHSQRLVNRDYQLSLASWIAQFDDPMSILERFKDSQNPKNYPGWESQHYQDLLKGSFVSTNRSELFQSAEQLLAKEVPFAPIYHSHFPALCSSQLEPIPTTPCGGILFEQSKRVSTK